MLKTHLIEQWFVGTVLITTGLLILYTLHILAQSSQETWFDLIRTVLVIEAYFIIASLFILIQLRYLLGIKRFKERIIKHKLR